MYLWANIEDLLAVGSIGGASPLDLMILPSKGDRLLDYYVLGKDIGSEYLVMECTDARAQAITGGLEMIGSRKLKRRIRTRQTKKEPGGTWKRIAQ